MHHLYTDGPDVVTMAHSKPHRKANLISGGKKNKYMQTEQNIYQFCCNLTILLKNYNTFFFSLLDKKKTWFLTVSLCKMVVEH